MNWADVLLTAPSYFLIVEKFSTNLLPSCLTMILEKHLVSKYNILSQLLPTAAITASMLVIARMMIIRPRSLLQHKKLTNIKREKIKEREKHHQNLRHQIQRILHPQKIHSKKVTLLKATDFKLSLNLGATNGSFLMKCQIMSITSLSVLFPLRMSEVSKNWTIL